MSVAAAEPILASDHDFLVGGGEMGALMRSLDWSRTALGPVESWPQSLRTSASTCLNCAFPILLWWGNDLTMLYNDEYVPVLGAKHPAAMGQRGEECWPEIWDAIGPMLRHVLETGHATCSRDVPLVLNRDGRDEECYFSLSYSPIRDETGGVGGVFTPVIETTPTVIGERRLRTLRDLAARSVEAPNAASALEQAASVLAENPRDLPFAAIYLIGPDRDRATLGGTAGLTAGSAICPRSLMLDANGLWPEASRAAHRDEAVLANDLPARFGAALPTEPWATPLRHALVLPVTLPGASQPAALLVAGLSTHRALDAPYREFLGLVAGGIGSALGGALERAEVFIEEALRWLPEDREDEPRTEAAPAQNDMPRSRILLADDNADMRRYVRRLLAGRYAVQAVGDGKAALQAALASPPDLVLSDATLPEMDGLALAAALRADSRTALVPIILLSARAGERAQVEGFSTGADDYLTKPLSARELLAHVRGNLELGRARRQAAERERRLRAEADAMRGRVETLIEHLPVGAGLFDTDSRVLVSNAPWRRYNPGLRLRSANPNQDRWAGVDADGVPIETADLPAQRALRGEVVRAQELRYRGDDGVERWTKVSAIPVHDADGAVVGAVGVIVDTDDARRAEIALRESEERFRVAADSAPALIWTMDTKARTTFVSRWFGEVFGCVSDVDGNGWRQAILPEDLDACSAAFLDAFRQRERFRRDVRVLDSEGKVHWLRNEGVPRYDGAGVFLGYTGCALDVTDSKEAEVRQHLLIAELNHRVKNTLATVQSLAQQSLRSTDAPAEFAAAFGARLLALARAHDLLTREEWEGATVADVAAAALAPWLGVGRIALAGPRVHVIPKQALALSMALGELATNAVKHGALFVPGGRVSLAWDRDGEDTVALEWAESGGPAVTPPMRRGLGSRLLGRRLAAELGGTVDLRFDPAGVRCSIGFPVGRRMAV